MEAILMSAGIITAIILSVVGLIKLPFNNFKKKYPKAFKATFTLLSIVITFGACLINQAFILEQPLFNTNFVIMLLSTYAGVFGLYLSYEGLGAKELVKRLLTSIKSLKANAPESKFAKCVDKIGVDKAFSLLAEKKIADEQKEEKIEEVVIENNNSQN